MAFGIDDAITAVADLGKSIVNAVAPDQVPIIQAKCDAAVKQLQATQAVMLAEAQSSDPYTSRARPSFMYVVYILILWAIPMSFIFAFAPETAAKITEGFRLWLAAIPQSLVNLFETVMLGYTGGRTAEKIAQHGANAWAKRNSQ